MRLLVLLLLAAPLAGCLSGEPAGPRPYAHVLGALRPSELVAGRFYSFQHEGGDVEISIRGDPAIFDLYAPDDRRLGRFLAEEGRSTVVFRGVASGEPVLVASQLNGTLGVLSGGREVTSFIELPFHYERQELYQFYSALYMGPLPGGVPPFFSNFLDEDGNVSVLRAPYHVGVLGRGDSEGLHVTLSSDIGPVFEAQDDVSSGTGPAFNAPPLSALAGDFYSQNVRNGTLAARLRADAFDGVLLLSATSYSRAQPARAANASIQREPLAYDYFQELVGTPSLIHVHDEARQLGFAVTAGTPIEPPLAREHVAPLAAGLRVDEDEPEPEFSGIVLVWGPDDRKLATLPVPVNGTVVLPIERGGDYVVWPAVGHVTPKADVGPTDFAILPQSVDSIEAARTPAGSSTLDGAFQATYATASEPIEVPGVVFRVETEVGPSSPGPGGAQFGCQPRPLLRLVQDNETLGAWGGENSVETDVLNATLRLAGGDLAVLHDGFGSDGCDRTFLRLHYFMRSMSPTP